MINLRNRFDTYGPLEFYWLREQEILKELSVMIDVSVEECMRMLKDHRSVYHKTGDPSCIVCRSLKRSIVRGI